jgi:hypothetical protein
MRSIATAIAFVGTLAASALLPPTDVRAGGKFDGPWSVVVLTTKGKCDPSYRFSGQIVNGGIYYSYGSLAVTGRVEESGATNVHVTYGTDHGEAHGRLLETYGTGTWSGHGPDGLCSGTWVATRAGGR